MEKKSSEQIYLSVIIPAYNEEERLPRALEPTIEFLRAQPYNSEIIIVSDGSTDRTKEVAESFLKEFPRISTLEYFPHRGKGYAVKTGMLASSGEYRIFMDADYAVPVKFIPVFSSYINQGFDIVIASRGLPESKIEVHQNPFRELAAKALGRVQRLILGLPFIDTQCGFKLFTKKSAESLFPQLFLNCSYFDSELLFIAYQARMKIKEVGVYWRHDGQTRLPIDCKRGFEILIKMFIIPYLHRRPSKE
jgi:glycosyltransferase involved in cell wall biosynthesis